MGATILPFPGSSLKRGRKTTLVDVVNPLLKLPSTLTLRFPSKRLTGGSGRFMDQGSTHFPRARYARRHRGCIGYQSDSEPEVRSYVQWASMSAADNYAPILHGRRGDRGNLCISAGGTNR